MENLHQDFNHITKINFDVLSMDLNSICSLHLMIREG